MEYAQKVVDLWKAGNPAPYDLYDHAGQLVEASSYAAPKIICKGDVISEEIADRVVQHHIDAGQKIQREVLVWDKDGNIKTDNNGNPVTEILEIDDIDKPIPLTYLPTATDVATNICDQCGLERSALFVIGSGRYCKNERSVNGNMRTCYDVRMEQLGAKK